MGLWKHVAAQFGKPVGLPGAQAGFIMAHRSSNDERNRWAISLLHLKPGDRVLEIGFGPGTAIREMRNVATSGFIWGLDHSPVMVRQASRRNARGIAAGNVALRVGSVSEIPSSIDQLDKVLSINSYQFWHNPAAAINALYSRLRTGGVIAIVHQPRKPGSVDADADAAGESIAERLRRAGFTGVRIEKKQMKPVATVCVLGVKTPTPGSVGPTAPHE